ncbi:MAG TPA: GGDEF domain-containing protein [Dehalococcoidia bacterium]|nr:GGDEF domain-containing protein [Dehalococcoidia bacterium]
MKPRGWLLLVLVPLAGLVVLVVDAALGLPDPYDNVQDAVRVSLIPVVIVLGAVLIYLALGRREDRRRQAELNVANERLIRSEARLQELAVTDPLTGVYNRRQFYENLSTEYRRSRRYHRPLALLLIDVDHFKAVNDRHGHTVGDEVLKTLAQAMKRELRSIDVLARFGGEEFIVLLPETTTEAAVTVAEKLRRRAASTVFGVSGAGLTVSVGVAGLEDAMSSEDDLVQAADQALYRAKERGRNRLAVASWDIAKGVDIPA